MKRRAFFLLYLLILLLSIITFIEKSRGTPFVLEHFYGSWWFALLWGILALTGMLCFFRHKRHRMYSLSLHLSLVIILLGALLTSLTAICKGVATPAAMQELTDVAVGNAVGRTARPSPPVHPDSGPLPSDLPQWDECSRRLSQPLYPE